MGRCAGEIWTFNPWTLLWTASSLDWGGGWGTWSCPDLCPERTKVPARWTSGWIVNISAAQSMGPSSAFCPKALSLFSDSGEQLWTLSARQACQMFADPRFFSLEAALPPLRSAGVRGVQVLRLPQGRGSKSGAGWALGRDSGPWLRDAEPDPLLAGSREWGVVRKIGRNNPCPLNCLGLIRRLIMYSVCLGWKWVIASLLI